MHKHSPYFSHFTASKPPLVFKVCFTEVEENMKRLFFATLLLFALLLSSSFLEPTMAKSLFCTRKCKGRCAKAAVQERCLKYCGICCAECKCVPSGTSGNKHQCPCYRDRRNSKGKPKCP